MTSLTATDTVRPTSSLPPMVKGFAWSSIGLTVMTFAVKAFCAFVLNLTGVYRQIVFKRSLLFVDFTCFFDRFRDFHNPNFFAWDGSHGLVFMYPAPTALPYELFYLLPYSLFAFLAVSLAGIAAVALAFRRTLVRNGLARAAATFLVIATVLCSYPLYVEVFLANIEIVVVFIVGSGIYLFLKRRPYWAAVCFGVAGAMKLFPFIFFALLFTRRQYRQILLGLVVAVLLELFSLWLVSSSIVGSLHGVNDGLNNFRRVYILGPFKHDIGIDHSLFGLYKGALILFNRPWPSLATMNLQLRIYVAATALIGLGIYVWRLRVLPVLNQVLVLTMIGIFFTAASHDYTLLHMYVPLGMMVLLAMEASKAKYDIPGLKAMFACMTLVLAPLAEFVHNDLIYGAQIKAVVLGVFLILALVYPLSSRDNMSTYAPQG